MARAFYPFGVLERDGSDYDNPNMDEVRNALPVYRIYRPVRRAEVVSSSEPSLNLLSPWVDFNGTSTGRVDFSGNPIDIQNNSGLSGSTVLIRFRTTDTSPGTLAGATDPGGGSFGWRMVLTSGGETATGTFTVGSIASPGIQFQAGVSPGGGFADGEWHIAAWSTEYSTGVATIELDLSFGIDSTVATTSSGEVLFSAPDWQSLDMRWGLREDGTSPFEGDIERVVVVDEALDLDDWDNTVLPIMDNTFDGLSDGGFQDGHIWLLRENTGTTVNDFADNGPLDGTMAPGATWEGGAFLGEGASGITGGIAHFYTRARELLSRGPIEDALLFGNNGFWQTFGRQHPDFPDDFFRHIWSQEPDDSRGIFFSVSDPQSTDGSSLYEAKLRQFPDPGADTEHRVSYRYKFNGPIDQGHDPTFELRAQLLDGNMEIAELNNHVSQQATEDWVHVNADIPAVDVANIGDYSNLRVRFTATMTDSPRQNSFPNSDLINPDGWENEDGSTSDLWESINDFGGASPEDTFVRSPGIAPGGTSRYRFGLTDIQNPMSDEGFNVVVRADTDEPGMDLVVQLIENGEARSIRTFTDIPTIPTSFSFQPDPEDVRDINDYDKLQMQVAFKAHGDPGEVGVSGLIPEVFTFKGDDVLGVVTNLQKDDASFVSAQSQGEARFRVALSAGEDPGTNQDHRIRMRALRVGGQAGVSVQLQQGGTTIFDSRDVDGSSGQDLPTSEAEIIWDLPISVVQQITSYQNLQIQVLTHGGQSGGAGLYDLLALEYPGAGTGGRRGTVYWAVLGTPSKYWVGVSWARMFAPDPEGAEEGDRTELYAGDYNNLYMVDDSPWSVVSKAGGYAGTLIPRSWAFCGFGDNLVATNKVDPVQVKLPENDLFEDLITSTQQPQSAACAVVRRHLILGNIEYTSQGPGDPDGHPDEWWCSALDAPEDFDISLTTGSNRGRTQGTPGEIVGMTGGDFALLFKRNSVQRLDYVGPPGTFKEAVVSSTDGTEFPRSIIQFGRDAYFLDTDGFKVVRQGQYIERIGDGAVNRMITDTAFEPRAVQPVDSDAIPEKESAVIGAYDSVTDTLWWAVRTRGIAGDDPAPVWQNNVLFIYNPTEDRWAVIELIEEDGEEAPLRVTHLYSLPTTEEASDSVARGIGLITISGTFPIEFQLNFERFLGQDTYPATFITKIWSSKLISQDIEKLKINAVRPSFRMAPEATARPDVLVRVESSEDPLMQLDVNEEEHTIADANSSLWYPFLIHGEYFRFTVGIPSLVNETVRELNGIGIDHEDAGRKP